MALCLRNETDFALTNELKHRMLARPKFTSDNGAHIPRNMDGELPYQLLRGFNGATITQKSPRLKKLTRA